MLTDRDIVVKALAQDKDPGFHPGGRSPPSAKATARPVTIGADDLIDQAMRTMIDHKIRRVPMIDGRELVGIISQADIATNLPKTKWRPGRGDLGRAIVGLPGPRVPRGVRSDRCSPARTR